MSLRTTILTLSRIHNTSRLLHTSCRVYAISEEGLKINESSSGHSRSAAEQRRVLEALRESVSSPSPSAKPESILKGSAAAGGAAPQSMGLGLGSSIYASPSKKPRGLIQKATGEGKKWSELKAGQKVARGTQKTYQFSMVLGGAVLVGLIVVALGSELYAPNSPTVIFKDACKRVEDCKEVRKYAESAAISPR